MDKDVIKALIAVVVLVAASYIIKDIVARTVPTQEQYYIQASTTDNIAEETDTLEEELRDIEEIDSFLKSCGVTYIH